MKVSKSALRLIIILALLSIIVSLLFSYQLAFAIISIILVFLGLNKMLSASIFDTTLLRFIVAMCIYLGVLQVTTMLVWLINVNFPLDQVIPAATALSLVFFLTSLGSRKDIARPAKSPSRINRFDIISLSISLLFLLIIVVPPLKDARVNSSEPIFPKIVTDHIGTGTDDANHAGMIIDRLNSNRGVLYKTDAAEERTLTEPAAISSYPPGWHSANAALMIAFNSDIKDGGEALVAYIFSKLFWFFILLYLFARVTFIMARLAAFKLKGATMYIYLTAFIGFFTYYSLLGQYKEGFYSFMPQLIAVLLAGLLLTQLWQDFSQKNVDNTTALRSLSPLAYVVSLSALSWFLITPALAFAVLVPLVVLYRQISKDLVWQLIKLHGVTVLACIAAVALQLYLITSGSARNPSAGITEAGALAQFSPYYYTFIGVGVFFLLHHLNKKSLHLNGFISLAGFILALSLAIALYQVKLIGHIEYYFFKPLGTAMILLMPIAFTGWVYLLESLTNKLDLSSKLLIATAFIVSLPLVVGVNPVNTSHLQYILGNRTFSTQESTEMYSIIAARPIAKDVTKDEIAIGFIPEDAPYNIIVSNLLNTNAIRVNKCQARLYGVATVASTTDDLIKALQKCSNQDGGVTILTRGSSYDDVQNALQSANLAIQPTLQKVD